MMLSGTLLPAHPKPLPDELLSSWIVRIAEANGVKLHTLSRLLFGSLQRSPWMRDIGRLAPDWVLNGVCRATGIPMAEAMKTTLHGYLGLLFPERRLSGQLRWILPIKAWSAKRKGYGVQYCPRCLAEDDQPYFRRRWRVALYTFCPEHEIMLFDACPWCGEPVAFHRRDFSRDMELASTMAHCHNCGADFRSAEAARPELYGCRLFNRYKALLREFHPGKRRGHRQDFYAVLHQLCRVLVSRSNKWKFASFIASQLPRGENQIARIEPRTRWGIFESLRIDERYVVVSLALWLMMDLKKRLGAAMREKAVRYNHLYKDFKDAPEWYVVGIEQGIVDEKLSD